MGEEHELKGLGSLGKKTPVYRWGKSNCYAHSPHRAVLPLQGAVLARRQKASRTARAVLLLVLTVLPLDLTVLPQMVAVLLLASGTKKNFRAYLR